MGKDDAKIRLIAVYRMMEKGERLTSTQILEELERKYGITAKRQTIYSDMRAVDRFIPIKSVACRNGGMEKWVL